MDEITRLPVNGDLSIYEILTVFHKFTTTASPWLYVNTAGDLISLSCVIKNKQLA
jgi:hypothetical protein